RVHRLPVVSKRPRSDARRRRGRSAAAPRGRLDGVQPVLLDVRRVADRRRLDRTVTAARRLAWIALGAGAAIGTWSDRVEPRVPLFIGGYRVVAADFHVHNGVPGAAALAPWDLVFEARRRGLDAFALTPHNEVFSAKVGRWVSRLAGGPTVLVGEEI